MRLSIKRYQDGTNFALETSNDGARIIANLTGKRKPGKRIRAYAEVIGEDSAKGMAAMVEVLAYLKQELVSRAERPDKTDPGEPRKRSVGRR